MQPSRRQFLKWAGLASGGVFAARAAASVKAGVPADQAAQADVEFYGLLIDTTKCIGCRACEEACNSHNKLPEPDVSFSSESVFETVRDTTEKAWLVVNRFADEKAPDKELFVRMQCMHCNQPSCASACLCKAMEKTPEGPVIYHEDRCMGCRYCMISCPFDVPKFEYDSPTPFVEKCIGCPDLVSKGEPTACAQACPEGATLFGKRRDLIEEAKRRIYQNPERFHPHIYGEREVGGTGFLYLSAVPFEKIGFRTDLGTTSYPELTSGFLSSVPLVDILWPAVLFGFNYLVSGKEEGNDKEGGHGN
ncbi:MAG: 4Fe-4S dicluster domain-containing protein [Deltaproteobacteria bacterium]|nr:4Fe-4S dicluster domain-containing protein [Deltaproteobacteria bacterium]